MTRLPRTALELPAAPANSQPDVEGLQTGHDVTIAYYKYLKSHTIERPRSETGRDWFGDIVKIVDTIIRDDSVDMAKRSLWRWHQDRQRGKVTGPGNIRVIWACWKEADMGIYVYATPERQQYTRDTEAFIEMLLAATSDENGRDTRIEV